MRVVFIVYSLLCLMNMSFIDDNGDVYKRIYVCLCKCINTSFIAATALSAVFSPDFCFALKNFWCGRKRRNKSCAIMNFRSIYSAIFDSCVYGTQHTEQSIHICESRDHFCNVISLNLNNKKKRFKIFKMFGLLHALIRSHSLSIFSLVVR